MKLSLYIFTLAIMVISMTGCQNVNLTEEQFTGMDKAEVVNILGEPDKAEEPVKNTEYIFGPIEGLWDQIEMGEKIVIWMYETRNG